MTQNGDVEFVRRLAQKPPYCEVLLAHIDHLEGEIAENWIDAAMSVRAPSVDEIAADLYARWVTDATARANHRRCAELAYQAAEALVAERETRRRQDGLL